VTGVLQRLEKALTEPAGTTGDEYVHGCSVAGRAPPAQPYRSGRIRVVADGFEAVLFDWRGTLVATSSPQEWIREALRRLGRPARDGEVDELAARLDGAEDTLDGPGVDCDADLHRHTYRTAFRDLGIDDDLAEALYAVESDPAADAFADDAAETLHRLRAAGLRLAVVSDIHVDIRPAFAPAGLVDLIDVFTLSFEQGVQKPDPRMFTRTLAALGADAASSLMVGDRSRPDGAAVEAGLTTLLLPPLTSSRDRRLHRVSTLCGVP
jgi:FMN phosphatase YigB (HAD superfamily)